MKKHIYFLLFLSVSVISFAGVGERRVEDLLFVVECAGGSRGSAFLMQDTNGVWMVSNYHVVSGERQVKFINMVDESIEWKLPEIVEIAEDRDAMRFRVAETNGFVVADDYSFDDEVAAFGNSGGLGVITKNKGEVVGQGADEIEVTCEIIEGNSGGPVVNVSNQVIGIATFIVRPKADFLSDFFNKNSNSKKTTDGTRYENYRRFAIPLKDAAWQEVSLGLFEEEHVRFQERLDECVLNRTIISLMCHQLPVSKEMAEEFIRSSTVRKYNEDVSLRGFTYFNGRISITSDPFEVITENDKVFRKITKEASAWNLSFRELIASEFQIKYFINSLADSADLFDQDVNMIQEILEKENK